MNKISITIPAFLFPKRDLENPCDCEDIPIETRYKNGRVFWLKKEGDMVEEQEPICELEMEKKTATLPAPAAGVLAKHAVEEGGEFSADSVLGFIQEERPPIRLYLISGFLGSGKTTLLQRLLQGYAGQRIGVIVNEFGQVGIDGTLVQDQEVKVVEINNGSIFCACLKDGFVRTLKALSEQPIDLLFIENSGMADPSSINRTLTGLAPYLPRPYEYRGSLCVVDSLTFLRYADMFMPVKNQILASSLVLINKTDLCDAATLEQVTAKVNALNPDALAIPTTYADLPLEIFESKLFNNRYEGESSNTPGSRPTAYLLEDEGHHYHPDDVAAFCEEEGKELWRIKGFFPTAQELYHLDMASGQVDLRPLRSGAYTRTQIVLIGPPDMDPDTLSKAWLARTGRQIQLRQ